MSTALKYIRVIANSKGIANRFLQGTQKAHKNGIFNNGFLKRGLSLTSNNHAYRASGPFRPITSYAIQHADAYDQCPTWDGKEISFNVKHVAMLEEDRMLQVQWEDGQVTRYPYVWLKDNCQCEECFHSYTAARLLLMRNLDVNIRPQSLVLDTENKQVLITWIDGHESPVKFDWLRKRSFNSQMHHNRDLMFRQRPILWGNELQGNLPQFDFEEVISSDEALYNFLTRMEEYGVSLIRNAPYETGQVEKIASRISYMRMTAHGFIYTVKAREDPPNLAWTSDPLGLHTDFPYLHYTPGFDNFPQLDHLKNWSNCGKLSRGGPTVESCPTMGYIKKICKCPKVCKDSA